MINIPTDSSETHDDSDAFLEDAVDEWMDEEDPSYNESLVTMRQSRDTMNRLRSARGFFKGKIDGVVEESNGPGMQKGKGKGKTKGKGKGRGRPAVRCKNCGRRQWVRWFVVFCWYDVCLCLHNSLYPHHHCHNSTSKAGVSVDNNAVAGASSN